MGSDKLVLFSFQNEPASPDGPQEEVPLNSEPLANVTTLPATPAIVREKQTTNSKIGVGKMDVMKMLVELRQEREHIEEAILTLERLARGRGKRRGRPPAWMKEVKRRGRPPGSKNKAKEVAVG